MRLATIEQVVAETGMRRSTLYRWVRMANAHVGTNTIDADMLKAWLRKNEWIISRCLYDDPRSINLRCWIEAENDENGQASKTVVVSLPPEQLEMINRKSKDARVRRLQAEIDKLKRQLERCMKIVGAANKYAYWRQRFEGLPHGHPNESVVYDSFNEAEEELVLTCIPTLKSGKGREEADRWTAKGPGLWKRTQGGKSHRVGVV